VNDLLSSLLSLDPTMQQKYVVVFAVILVILLSSGVLLIGLSVLRLVKVVNNVNNTRMESIAVALVKFGEGVEAMEHRLKQEIDKNSEQICGVRTELLSLAPQFDNIKFLEESLESTNDLTYQCMSEIANVAVSLNQLVDRETL
jgi:hypothetical protein